MIKTFSRGPQHFLPWQQGWIWHQLTQEVKNKICGQFKLPFQRFFNNLRLETILGVSFFRPSSHHSLGCERGQGDNAIGSSLSWTVGVGRNLETNDDFIGPAMDVKKRGCFYFIFFFGHTTQHSGSYFPNQGSILCPLQWRCRVWTTGPPGKSQKGGL